MVNAWSEIVETSCRINFDRLLGEESVNLNDSFSLINNSAFEYERNDIFSQLPPNVRDQLQQHRGVTKLFEWQEKILELPCIYNGGNLIYSSPTGGGKTLVSELIMMREVLTNNKNAIYVVPYISLAHEKVASLAPLGCSLGFHVEEYASSKGSIPPRKRYRRKSIYVSTIEKASLLLNALFEEDRIDSIGVIVVDEIHMLNEPKRGVTLELLLTRVIHKQLPIQIIGMSATLKNVDDLCSFLKATYFSSTQRPIVLQEYICLETSLYSVNSITSDWRRSMRFDRALQHSNNNISKNLDILIQLTKELTDSTSCLVFCPNRKNCEVTCEQLAKHVSLNKAKLHDRIELIKSLEFVTGGVCSILRACIPRGIAYHHAGMADDERKILEEGFLCGTIFILCCTSTLAAGVNLPAFRVVIKSPFVGTEPLNGVNYRQMIGRAGRPGLSEFGESILILENNCTKMLEKIFSTDHICSSALRFSNISELSTIVLSLATQHSSLERNEIIDFFKSTLYYQQLRVKEEIEQFTTKIEEAINHLLDKKLLTNSNIPTSLSATPVGSGLVNSGIEVKRFESTHKNLKSALSSLVLSSDLHLIYICSSEEIILPLKPSKELLRLLSGLTTAESQLIADTGLEESLIYKHSIHSSALETPVDIKVLIVRWFNALLVYQLYKGRSVWSVHREFEITRGALQLLVSNAVSNASSLFRFVKNLKEFWCIKLLLEEMVKKLSMINCMDVLPLLEISGVKLARAKQLYQAGYRTVSDVASANLEALIKTIPHLSRRQAACLISSAELIIREQVETLRDEADQIITKFTKHIQFSDFVL